MSFGTCHSCRLPCLVFPWTRRENEVPTKNRKNRINAKFSCVGTFVSFTTRDVLMSSVKIEIRRKKTCVHDLHAPNLFLDL